MFYLQKASSTVMEDPCDREALKRLAQLLAGENIFVSHKQITDLVQNFTQDLAREQGVSSGSAAERLKIGGQEYIRMVKEPYNE